MSQEAFSESQRLCGEMNFKLQFDAALAEIFVRDKAVVVRDALPEKIISAWREVALNLNRRFGIDIVRRAGGHLLSYRVVPGEVLREHAPEIFAFYESPETCAWVRRVTGAKTIVTSSSLRSAININTLEHTGQRYRWHFDANPYTMLLYLTDHSEEDGGALEFYPNSSQDVACNLSEEERENSCSDVAGKLSEEARIRKSRDLASYVSTRENGYCKTVVLPRAGMLALMDGSRCYHSVAPLRRDLTVPRISIPMVYPLSREHDRPVGLDDYLYRAN